MAKKQIKVPFYQGAQCTYAWNHCTMVDNYEFEAELRYNGYSRGRSSLHIEWEDVNSGTKYTSGMKLFDEILSGQSPVTMINCDESLVISGVFTFRKQGTSILLTSANINK